MIKEISMNLSKIFHNCIIYAFNQNVNYCTLLCNTFFFIIFIDK